MLHSLDDVETFGYSSSFPCFFCPSVPQFVRPWPHPGSRALPRRMCRCSGICNKTSLGSCSSHFRSFSAEPKVLAAFFLKVRPSTFRLSAKLLFFQGDLKHFLPVFACNDEVLTSKGLEHDKWGSTTVVKFMRSRPLFHFSLSRSSRKNGKLLYN